MVVASLVVLAVVGPLVLFDVIRRPLVRRLGLRNLVRRPGEASLVVVGSMLGTALIVASFIVGDSFGTSFRSRVESELGPIDIIITTDDADRDLAALRAAVPEPAPVDGLLAVQRADVLAANQQGRIEPNLTLWEVEPAELAAFGDSEDRARMGDLPGVLEPDELALNRLLADELRVGVGDRVNLLAGGGTPIAMTVAAILPTDGLSSFADIVVAPCAVRCHSAAGGGESGAFQPVVVLSNTGNAIDGAAGTEETLAFIESTLGQTTPPFAIKQVFLARADSLAEEVTAQFATVSGFSVAAAVLLLINLFVMLSIERTVELGTMRAVGLQQGTARRAFTVECAVYSAAAVGLGVVVGIGVAAAVIGFASESFGVERGFRLRMAVEPSSVASAAAIGLAISLAAGALTSDRLTRLNIVTSLKDAGSTGVAGGHDRRVALWGLVGVATGVMALVLAGRSPYVILAAPVLVAVSAMPILGLALGRRAGMAIGAVSGLGWASGAMSLLPDRFDDPDVELFLVQGLVMVGLATVLVGLIDPYLILVVRRALRRSVAGRLGLTQPLASPARSGLLLAMYALVLFTITFIAVINAVLDSQAPRVAAQAGGSYDLIVNSSVLDPLTAEQLTGRADVAVAVTVEAGTIVTVPPGEEQSVKRWAVAVPEAFADHGPPVLEARARSYPTDTAAWRALGRSNDLIIAPEGYGYDIGDLVPLISADGTRRHLRVAGLSAFGSVARTEYYLPNAVAEELLVDRAQFPTRQYVRAADGVNRERLAADLDADFAANGAAARTFIGEITRQAAERAAFVEMLQAFLGLGFLIGIAGLGVALVRSVRDRRRQLGMLRAIGFDAAVLRNSFLVEATFIGVRGLALGIGLGLLMGWQVLTRSPAFDRDLGFVVPAGFLLVLAGVALASSLLAGLAPAIRAGRVAPAEALRVSG